MKKKLLFLSFGLCYCICSYAQVGLGNLFIENDNFILAKRMLLNEGYTAMLSNAQMKSMGVDPNQKFIATKGSNPSNSLMSTINGEGDNIKSVDFVCSKPYAMYLEKDLKGSGYSEISRGIVTDGRFKVEEVLYKRKRGELQDKVVLKKFTDGSGGAMITFTKN